MGKSSLLFQVVDEAHVHFADNVGVRVTITHTCLREVMKKEGCSTDHLLAISQKLRQHFKKGDEIYAQSNAEVIGLLLQNGEERFGKEGGARIFAELETHYLPAFDARTSTFDWKPLTERYKPAVPQEKKVDEPLLPAAAKAEAAKTEMAEGAEEGDDLESDTESVDSNDSHVIKTPKAASAPETMETPVTPPTAGSSKEAPVTASPKQKPESPTAAQRSPSPVKEAKQAPAAEATPQAARVPTPESRTSRSSSPEIDSKEGETDGTEEDPVNPITPRAPSPSMTVSPVKEATAEKSVPAQTVKAPAEEQAGSAPASPKAVFVPIDETVEEPKQEAIKPATVAAAVPATPFSSPAVQSFETPVSKSRLGPPRRLSAADQLAQMQSPEVAQVNTADRNWLLKTSKLGEKTVANGGTLPHAWKMSPGTQTDLNSDALYEMGLSPMSPLPNPIKEENTGDLASLPSLPSGSKTETLTRATGDLASPLSGSKTVTLTRAEVIEARAMFKFSSAMSPPLGTETPVHESDDGQQIRFHDGDSDGTEKKSMSETT